MLPAGAAISCTPYLRPHRRPTASCSTYPTSSKRADRPIRDCVRQAGDFFVDRLPSGDTYLLMDILHDWPDEEAGAILSAIADAAADDARVLVLEPILPESLTPAP